MQCHREPAGRVGPAVEEAAVSATVIPLLTYDKLYPRGDSSKREEKNYGSRTPPLYSLSCANRRLLCTLDGGAKLSLGPCACCLRWRNHPSSPWEVGGKKPPGDGSTTLAPRARFAPFPSCTLGKITSLLLGLLLHACVVPAAESRSFRGCAP